MGRVLKLNSSTETEIQLPAVLAAILADCETAGATWSANPQENGSWELCSEQFPEVYVANVDGDNATLYDRDCSMITSPCACSSDLVDWLYAQMDTHQRLADFYAILAEQERGLNCELTKTGAERIKTVFKAAQDAVDFPKGFRYTAFRQNRSEDSVLSTLMYSSTKLGATQWVVKSALSASLEGELVPGSDAVAPQNSWSFQPNYDPEAHGGDFRNSGSSTGYERGDQGIRAQDKFFQFPEDPNKNPTDMQAARWLVLILQQMIDDILENPPARCYEYLLADGLLKKKNIAKMSDAGLLRLVIKGVIDGVTALKAKPSLWKTLTEKGFVTGEQAYKVQPSQLYWLTAHDYIPVERALDINPELADKLARVGKVVATEDAVGANLTPDELVAKVADGVLTPQKAWSVNHKVLKPLVEAQLIEAYDAYKLDPSILNWMLENHYIGRAEAKKLKPTIKKEMDKKGVDWESLDASRSEPTPDDFELAVQCCGNDFETIEALKELGEQSGIGYLDLNPYDWFRSLDLDFRRTAWSIVEPWYEEEPEDLDSAARVSTVSTDTLQKELEAKLREVLQSPSFGFDPEDIDDVCVVEVHEEQLGFLEVEVRAEVSYSGMEKLAQALNPIVEQYDADAYFDQVTSGIMTAVIQ